VVWNQTAEALRAAPGVDSVAISRWPLLGRIRINSDISINGAPPSPTPAWFLDVSPGWLSTMKIPLVSGRDFRPEDTSPGAAIVNETFVKTFFPGQDPIGHTFERGAMNLSTRSPSPPTSLPPPAQPIRPVFYVPREIDDKSAPRPWFATFTIHTDTQNTLALADSFASSLRSATSAFASRTSPRSSICSATRPFAGLLAMLAASLPQSRCFSPA
jgi:hypothetical protein